MAHAEIQPGVCGCITQVEAEPAGSDNVRFHLESTCEKVQKIGAALTSLPLMDTLAPFLQNPVYQAAHQHQLHVSCPVPAGILKAAEVAGGLALPQEAHIVVQR